MAVITRPANDQPMPALSWSDEERKVVGASLGTGILLAGALAAVSISSASQVEHWIARFTASAWPFAIAMTGLGFAALRRMVVGQARNPGLASDLRLSGYPFIFLSTSIAAVLLIATIVVVWLFALPERSPLGDAMVLMVLLVFVVGVAVQTAFNLQLLLSRLFKR